ncbi:MAG: hypothetical protein OEW49_02690 [Nitrosopumilus sp.]|nr:hypothetical protein [Nitrosopumilus sp.]
MNDQDYLSTLKNKEFFILRKLCDDSITSVEREELENRLKETRLEIKKLE